MNINGSLIFESVKPLSKKVINALFFGGYEVKIGNKEIPFDWYTFESNITQREDGKIEVHVETEDWDSDSFIEEHRGMKLTPELLTSGELTEAFYECITYDKDKDEETHHELKLTSFKLNEHEFDLSKVKL